MHCDFRNAPHIYTYIFFNPGIGVVSFTRMIDWNDIHSVRIGPFAAVDVIGTVGIAVWFGLNWVTVFVAMVAAHTLFGVDTALMRIMTGKPLEQKHWKPQLLDFFYRRIR